MKTIILTTIFGLLCGSCLAHSVNQFGRVPATAHLKDLYQSPCQINPDLQCNCTTVGFFPYPKDPTKYIQCQIMDGSWAFYAYNCPVGSEFVGTLERCVMV